MHNSPNWGTKPPGVSCWVWRLSGVQDRTCSGASRWRLCYVHELVCAAAVVSCWGRLLPLSSVVVRWSVWLAGKTCRDRGFPAELSTGTQWWPLFTSPVNDFIIVADWALINVLYMLHRLFPLNEPLWHQEERRMDTYKMIVLQQD